MKFLSILFLLVIPFSGSSQNEINIVTNLGFGYARFTGELNGKYSTYSNPAISFGVGINSKRKIDEKVSVISEIGLARMGYSVKVNDFIFEPKTRGEYSSYRLYTGAELNFLVLEKHGKRGIINNYSCGIQPIISYQFYGVWRYNSDNLVKANTKYSNFDFGLNFRINYQQKKPKKNNFSLGISYYMGLPPTLEKNGENAYLRGFSLNAAIQIKKPKHPKR